MSFEELCKTVCQYVESLPTESEYRRDDWRGLLDETLANIRAALSEREMVGGTGIEPVTPRV